MGQVLSSQIKTFYRERILFAMLACLAGAFFLFLLVPQNVWAQTSGAGADVSQNFGLNQDFNVAVGQKSDLKNTVATVINIVLGFLGVIAVILIMYAGFLYLTARGNEDQVKKAKLILRNALIGLVIILSAWGIAAFVINQLSGATGNGSGADSGNGGGGLGGGLSSEKFALQEFQTSHAGATSRDDVYRGCKVQTRFNHWLALSSVGSNRTGFKAIQRQDGAGNKIDGPLSLAIDARNNAIVLERRNNDNQAQTDKWPANSQIELQVPKGLTDVDAKALLDCTALGCNDNGSYYSWHFTTTDKEDSQPPALVSAYPPLPADQAVYPARNVSRTPIFSFNFSEAVDVSTVTGTDNVLLADNVKVEQIKSGTDQTVVALIPNADFDANVLPTGVSFGLNKNHKSVAEGRPYLEPFAWYRVTVQNIKDLCNNQLASTQGQSITWLFQTNGNAPGVDFTYPADKYQFACPNTEAFVQFKTSMYDVKHTSCVVSPASGGLVVGGGGFSGRKLAVRDNIPAAKEGIAIDPNAYCKHYDFLPASAELAPNATYSPNVDWRNPANDAQIEKTSWSFAVKPAGECANSPYISRVSPDTGPWGRCLTVAGNYFGAAADRAGSDAYAGAPKAGPDQALGIKDYNWNDHYLVGEFSARPAVLPEAKDGMADFFLSVSRNIVLGGQATTLGSNKVSFRVPVEAAPYAGACLLGLRPAGGRWGETVALNGTNFGAQAGTVTFSNRIFPAVTSNWSDSAISTVVPNESVDGDVQVATAAGLSNGLPFDVFMPLGGSCNVANDCEAGLDCRHGQCTTPVSGRFEIRNPQPAAACINSCADAVISFGTSKNIKPDTIKEANIKLLQCADENCASGSDVPSGVAGGAAAANRVEIKKALQPNNWYQVTILGGAGGLLSVDNETLPTPAYSWKFKTGEAVCGVSRIEITPPNGILYSAASYQYRAQAFSSANSCSPSGQQVAADFAWHDAARTALGTAETECANPTDESRLSLSPLVSNATTTAAVATFASADRQEHLAWICARSGAIIAAAPAALKPRCESNNDCKIGSCQATCNQQSKACEPKITGFQPVSGDIGTWVTINGCYLGNDWGAVKINNTTAVPPNNNFCASTWNNTQIIAEVAPGTSSGPIAVSRVGDGRTANTGQNFFVVNTNIYPGICRVQPASGRPGQEFGLFGKNFGSSRATDIDKLTATAGEAVLNVIDTAWSNLAIKATVPGMEAAKTVLLRVIKGNQSSNPVDFNIIVDSGDGTGTPPGNGDTVPGGENGTTPPGTTPPGTTPPGTTPKGITCENPWPATSGVPFSDQAQGGSTTMGNWTNFSTYYCRDKGAAGIADDLPDMSLRIEIDATGRDNLQPPQEHSPRHTTVPGLIKELFFTIPRDDAKNTDAIGIRVLQNPEHDSIAKWYGLQSFQQGTPQAMLVDGYKALRDGRTVYVAAPNDKDGDAGESEPIYTNVYLISMSDNAQPATVEIFNQLVNNFRLNINIRQVENRQALQRDAARLVDLRNLADIIEARPAAPTLNSGSYIKNLSTSVWPSWQGALSTDLGASLPKDPKNNIICSAPYDQATCYSRQSKTQFVCAAGSHIYQYQYSASSANFALKANLEYQGASWSHPAGGKWLGMQNDVCANVSYDSSR